MSLLTGGWRPQVVRVHVHSANWLSVSLHHRRSADDTSAPNRSFKAVHAWRGVSSSPRSSISSCRNVRHCPFELRAAIGSPATYLQPMPRLQVQVQYMYRYRSKVEVISILPYNLYNESTCILGTCTLYSSCTAYLRGTTLH